jgi:hypothetical protein
MRGGNSGFQWCPFCGVKFTHIVNYYEESPRQKLYREADVRGWRRSERRKTRYIVRIWGINPKVCKDSMIACSDSDPYDTWSKRHREHWDEDDWADHYASIATIKACDTSYWSCDEADISQSPSPFVETVHRNLSYEEAKRLIKENSSWPKFVERDLNPQW